MVDEDDLRLKLVENVIGHEKGIVRIRVERELAHEIHHRHGHAGPGGKLPPAAAGALRREIRRAQNALMAVQIRLQLIADPCMVSERDHVRPGGENVIRLARRDADNVGILPIDHAEIDAPLGFERLEPLLQK